jgi:hypothetical protein
MEQILTSKTSISTKSIRELKTCTKCLRKLNAEDFYICSGKEAAHCRDCHKWYVISWMKRNPEKLKVMKKKAYEKRKASMVKVSPDRDSVRVQPKRALGSISKKTQEPAANCQIANAQRRISKSMHRKVNPMWWPGA